MARVIGLWKRVGDTLQPVFTGGVSLLISGADKYLNFNSQTGESGYGLRDNSGTIEVKNASGNWNPIGTAEVISDLNDVTKSTIAPSSPLVGDLWIDLS